MDWPSAPARAGHGTASAAVFASCFVIFCDVLCWCRDHCLISGYISRPLTLTIMARTAEGTGSATVTWSQRCYIQRWKLGRDHNQQAALRIFANQTTCRLWSLQASIPRRGILQALCNFAKFRWQLLTVSWLGREPWAGSGVWRNKGNGQLKFFALLFTAWASESVWWWGMRQCGSSWALFTIVDIKSVWRKVRNVKKWRKVKLFLHNWRNGGG